MPGGKHSAESAGSFYRDLAMMIVGIVLVAAALFLLLYLVAREPEPEAAPNTATSPPTTVPTTEQTTVTEAETTTTAPTTTVPTSTTVPVRDPSQVRVVVLNSIGLAGAAGRKTQELADAGYQTLQAEDYQPEQDASRIWYRDGFSPEANALLEFLPGAQVEPIPDPDLARGADVVLVLGTGYEG